MHTLKTFDLAALLLLAAACSHENEPAQYAVVYGISQYPYPGLELSYSANDAVSTARLLEHAGYEVILRNDTAATLQNLQRDFATVSRIANDNDLFVFYFSGHGLFRQTLLDLGQTDVPDDYFSFLLYHRFTYDSIAEYVDANAVTQQTLSQLFGSLPPCLKVCIMDACYSGTLIGNQSVVDYSPDDYDGNELREPNFTTIVGNALDVYSSLKNKGSDIGYTMLASSGSKEVSWDGFFSHSVFTYFFLMSAEQGDLNRDGHITVLESYGYIYAACQKYWNTPAQNAEWNFLPQITGGAEDMIMFRKPLIINEYILSKQD